MNAKKLRRALLGMSVKSPEDKVLKRHFQIPVDFYMDADAMGWQISTAIDNHVKEKLLELIQMGRAGFGRYSAIHIDQDAVHLTMVARTETIHLEGVCDVDVWYQVKKGDPSR